MEIVCTRARRVSGARAPRAGTRATVGGMIGETLGSYRVTAKLGEGGMGAVYAAEHVVLGRRAAIKLLLPSLSSNQELVQRFFNEARATATLDHPGLVQVLDYGHTPGGSAFLVMELLAGETIARRLQRVGRLDYASAAGFCRQAAAAVGVAHAAGIVHRDLKPDNLFLVRDAEVALGERVKVLDFGIAKLTDAGPGVSSMTRTGAVLGTPGYMSPEQCRGPGEVDHRSDVYARGCILFEMVCGRPPFIGAGTGEIIGAHIFQERPSPRAFDPAIPPALEAIIGRALQKDPAARQQSMQQLGAELEELAARGGTQAQRIAVAAAVPGATGSAGWPAAPTPLGYAATAPGFGPGHAGAASMTPHPTTLGGSVGQQSRAPARSRGWVMPAVIAGVLGSAIAGVGFYAATSGGDGERASEAGTSGSIAAAGKRDPEPEREREEEGGARPAPPWAPRPGPERAASPEPERAPTPAPSPAPTPAPEPEPERAAARPLDLVPKAAPPPAARPASRAAPGEARSTAPRVVAAEKSMPRPPEPLVEVLPFAPRQVWLGHYVCAQGRTAMALRISSVRDHTVGAVFEFSHAATGATGSFQVAGRYDPGSRRLALSPGAWIQQPPNYQTVGLAGTVSADGSTFTGSIRNSACSTFTVRRR